VRDDCAAPGGRGGARRDSQVAGYSALLWAKERALASVEEMLHASGAAEICPPALALCRGLNTNVKLDVTK